MDNPQPSYFSASQTKLRRSAKFIQELEANLKTYADSKPYTATVDTSTNLPSLIISWTAICGDPEAIIGDCVHNLRASLDLMSCDLVRYVKGNDNRVYFPFAHAPEELDAVIKEKNFHRAGEDAVSLLKTFQPYRGGNQLLRAIHDLDIEDKHKALLVMGTSRNISVNGTYKIGHPKMASFAVTATDIQYGFPPDAPILPGVNIIQTLKDAMQLVDGILKAFANLIDLRSATP